PPACAAVVAARAAARLEAAVGRAAVAVEAVPVLALLVHLEDAVGALRAGDRHGVAAAAGVPAENLAVAEPRQPIPEQMPLPYAVNAPVVGAGGAQVPGRQGISRLPA